MNQFPKTEKQLELYSEFNRNDVQYVLIGGLAARFHERNRITKDVDLLVLKTLENAKRIKESLKILSYPTNPIEIDDFFKYEYIRIGGKMLIDIHSSYFGMNFEDVKIQYFHYENVKIPVADKPSLILLMSTAGFHTEDIKVLKLLDDPVNNADEINHIQ